MSKELLIGASTGWLYYLGITSIAKQKEFLLQAGASAVEISLGEWSAFEERMATLQGESFGFEYQSLHLPTLRRHELPRKLVSDISEIISRHNIQTSVFHPLRIKTWPDDRHYWLDCYSLLNAPGWHPAIENTNRRNLDGRELSEIGALVRAFSFGWVLDVQHAFENGATISKLKAFLNDESSHLRHLHVSGQTKDKHHSLVFQADNKTRIIYLVNQAMTVKRVPIILEGMYTTPEELKTEIDFIRYKLEN
jgi:hypothetical protein